MPLNHVRRGAGEPLLLLHGLGGNLSSWDAIAAELAADRELVVVDLPGFGGTPPLEGEVTIPAMADAVGAFLAENDLRGVDVVGVSAGARLALELARRGEVGATVALAPGGFWSAGQKRFFNISIGISIRLIKLLQPLMPFLTGNPVTRTLLFAQLSPRPWALRSELMLPEMRSFARSPSSLAALDGLVNGPAQEGAPAGSLPGPVTIVWGKQDLVTLPSQAETAQRLFPDARLEWLDRCGHFSYWDRPAETVERILTNTGAR